MSKTVDQLTALQHALHEADGAEDGSFARVFDTFLDLTKTTDLFAICEPVEDPTIREFIEAVVRQFTRRPKLKRITSGMVRQAEVGLIHGPLVADHRTGAFFYFVPAQQGLLALTDPRGLTHYLRLSAIPVPAGTFLANDRSLSPRPTPPPQTDN